MNTQEKDIMLTIIEDNRFVREGWLSILKSAKDIAVIGAYPTCEEGLQSPNIRDSDVVLMDIGLPGISGIEGAAYLHQHHPRIATVMCTVYEDNQKIFDALCAGAVGYLLKKIPAEELIKAIRDAAAGGSPMTPSIARKVISNFHKDQGITAQREALLTEAERQTLSLLALGKSYAAIAEELFISIDGVRTRIRKIYEKLQAHSRGEAVAKGVAKRLIHFPR